MSVSLSDINIGDSIVITDSFFENECISDSIRSDQTYLVVSKDRNYVGIQSSRTYGGYFMGGIYAVTQSYITSVVGKEPSLDEFKKQVVEAAQAAAKKHGWCSEVDNVLEGLGLGDLIAKEVTVDITYRVSIKRLPGETETALLHRAKAGVRLTTDHVTTSPVTDYYRFNASLVK